MSGAGQLVARGKVRDVYEAGADALLLVATDRISAFDVVLAEPVPDKGRVLTALSLHWFERTADLVGNHLLASDRAAFPAPFADEPSLAGRSLLVRRADVVPLECVARGYLSGQRLGAVPRARRRVRRRAARGTARVRSPARARSSRRRRRRPRATTCRSRPTEAIDLVGRGLYERLKELTLGIYERIASAAADRGVIVADTKFEFGFAGGDLLLVDEVGTPDSSRFWPADGYEPGRAQPSFDKQYVRDWLASTGWDREPPPPPLPADVIAGTAARYREAYERVTGRSFEDYRAAAGARDDPVRDAAALDGLRTERA